MTPGPVIFHCLRKTLPDGRLLLDIDRFDVRPGTCILLTGENGAGKTTLLKIVAALEAPDAAEVEYRGVRRPWRDARRDCGRAAIYLHQHPYLFDASVFDNVAYGLRRAGLPKIEIAARVTQALEHAGVSHLAACNARRLSGGEQQRVALTRAWVLAPEILLLDEPTANMDHDARERTYFLVQRLKTDGIGVVIASHEPHQLHRLADEHLHLHAGALRPVAHAARRPDTGVIAPLARTLTPAGSEGRTP